MSYTIASLEDIQAEVTYDFVTSGNKYIITIYNKLSKESQHKKYDTLDDAIKVFQKLTEVILTGCYSDEDRIKML